MPQQHDTSARDLVERYSAVWNGADDSMLDEVVTADFSRDADPLSGRASGIPELRELIARTRLDMPDLRVDILDAVYAGDRIATRWRLAGTDSGPGDFRPTGRFATAEGMSFFTIRDGKLAHEWSIADNVTLLTALGFAITPPD